ncbi:unnamed protein product, partial [Polarella glacialis]
AGTLPASRPSEVPGVEGDDDDYDDDDYYDPSSFEAKPGVVWIDFKKEAYKNSSLNVEESIVFRGFHDDRSSPDYEPRERWLEYILQRAAGQSRVAVVVLNKKHMQSVTDIQNFCVAEDLEAPRFVVCTRAPAAQFAEFGITDVTGNWAAVPNIAMAEVWRHSGGETGPILRGEPGPSTGIEC